MSGGLSGRAARQSASGAPGQGTWRIVTRRAAARWIRRAAVSHRQDQETPQAHMHSEEDG
jgi:hypothetical protein